tara:strand:+ start:214 stop:864 length:651 start_codon:yes stop_codon:yes gene_type:complete
METKQNNVIQLVDHITSKEEVSTFNPADIGYFKIEKDKITQKRIYSFMIDFSIVMLVNTAVHVAYSLFVKNFMFVLNMKQQSYLTSNNLPVQLSIFMLIYTTYFFYSMYVLNGQTVGKMVYKLTTINDSFAFDEEVKDHTLSLSQAWRRTFGYLACYFSFGTFFLFSFMSEDKRGAPDYFSQTRTVSNEWLSGMIAFKEISHEEVKIDITALDRAA